MKHLHVVVWQEDNWFVARALEVEVASQGSTEAEALVNLKEALELYFEDQPEVELQAVFRPKLQELMVVSDA